MRFSEKILFAFTVFLTAATVAFAQNSFSVKVKLVDSKSGAGIEYPTVSLTKEGRKEVFKYVQGDGEGKAEFKGIPAGKYVVRGILLGYDDYNETITVNKNVDLGTKKMAVQAEFLKGAMVSDVGNPIVIKKDTIEHNVSLMKTSDNEALEDLLKRIPGIEVESDGTITANGKTISKIQIDGKEFFMNDPSLASKNLPAKIVDKVRVVEKKSDQAQFTGIDDGEEETVLDLGIKKGMMNGWMGSLSGGAGTDLRGVDDDGNAIENDFRYQGSGFVANFKESSQLAVIGNINNTNNRGFQDMMSSAMGGMRGGGRMMGGNSGITRPFMLGTNGGYTFDNKSEIVGNVMGNGNRRYVEEQESRTTYNNDGSTLFANEFGNSTNNSYGIRAGARADIKVTDKTSFIFEPNFNYGWSDFREENTFTTDKTLANGERRDVNDGNSLSTGDGKSTSFNGRLLWRQRLGKPGRTISVNARYSYSKNTIDGYNYSLTESYDYDRDPLRPVVDSSLVDQQYNQLSGSNGVNGRMSYTEPLGKNFYMEANYSINYNKNTSTKDTYDKDESGRYIVRDDTYSSDVSNTRLNQSAGLSLRKQEEKYNFTVGANFEPQRTENNTKAGQIDTTLVLDVFNWSPNARLDIKFTDYKMLRFNYRGRSSQPSINQLMPIPDNSNPQRVTLGNMGLNPSFTHNMMIMYRGTNMENFASMHAELNGSYKPKSIVNATWTDDAGVQYTVPMNYEKATYSASGMLMFNSPLGKSKFSIMSFTRASYNNGVSFVGSSDIDPEDSKSYLNINNFTSNMYQNVSFMENLRFTYRTTIWEASIGGMARYSQAFYEISSKNVPATWTNSINGNFILNSDVIGISTDARYTFYKGYSEGFNDPTLVWNAEISKQLFKNRLTIAAKVYDILNQSKNTSRTTTDNYVLDRRNNTLGRYIMFSLTYRFGTFGQKGGMGMGPGGRGGRGPMGGGPGRR